MTELKTIKTLEEKITKTYYDFRHKQLENEIQRDKIRILENKIEELNHKLIEQEIELNALIIKIL